MERSFEINFSNNLFGIIKVSNGGRYTNGNYPIFNPNLIYNNISGVYCIYDVPGYHNLPNVSELSGGELDCYKSRQYPGSFLDLTRYETMDQFMRNNMSSKKRSEFKKFLRKSETVLNPTFTILHGDKISMDFIDEVLNALFRILQQRFDKKGIFNRFIKINQQEKLRYEVKDLIIKGKASLAFMKMGSEYISVSYQYHNGFDVLYSIPTFDDTLAKFNLGHIHLFHLIDYCFSKKYRYFDFSKGDGSYKSKWTDNIYLYHHIFIYSRDKFYFKYFAFLLKIKYDILQQMRNLGLNIVFKKLIFKGKTINSKKPHKEANKIDDVSNMNHLQRTKFFNFLYDNEIPLSQITKVLMKGNEIEIIYGDIKKII